MSNVWSRPRLLVWLPAVLGCAALAACGGSRTGDRVLVVGDSITVLSEQELDDRAERAERFTVAAANNATSDDLRQVVETFAGEEFEQVVVNLGMNDALNARPFDETTEAFAAILEQFESARCVHLTTLNESVVSFEDPELTDRVQRINAHVRELAATGDNVAIIDWNEALAEQRRDDETDESLLTDTVHPTDAGQELLVSLYLDAVKEC